LLPRLRQLSLHGFQLPLHSIDLTLQLLFIGVSRNNRDLRGCEHCTKQNTK